MAKTITFTAPPAAITDLSPTLVAGGTLSVATYYYTVVAVGTNAYYPDSNQTYSGASNEVTITTDASNKSVRLDWSAITGAVGYYVFRSTTSGTYTTARFKRETDNSTYYPTTTNNYFVDNGSFTLYATFVGSMIPTTSKTPMNLAIRTYGKGNLVCSGGSAGDPITLQNIYDNAVANSWTNWCAYDGVSFALMANWYMTTASTYFSATSSVIYIKGFVNIGGGAGSVIQFGATSLQDTIEGCIFYGYGNGNEEWLFYANTAFYGCHFVGVPASMYVSGIAYDFYVKFNGGVYANCYFYDFPHPSSQTDIFIKNLHAPANSWMTLYQDQKLIQNLEAFVHNVYYAGFTRMDSMTILSTTYHIYFYNASTGYNMVYIDPQCPNTTDADGLPVVYWANTIYTNYVDVFRSIQLKSIDKEGSPVTAYMTVTDVNGVVALDWDGTSLQNLQADASGLFFREKMVATSATASTITDSTKSWTTNQFMGRNLYVSTGSGKGQLIKIASNTSTALTLCENFVTTPVAGDACGIIMEIKQVRLTHTDGSGSGYIAKTTKTYSTPHKFKIFKDGYETEEIKVNLQTKLNTVVKLRNSISPGRDNMGSDFR